ncbi:hypothetical protein G5714_004200 [Onychostoma macrolepis]|uniref:Uncharacterized protein n=1 Tax=Onychostoma macrolepis TaxID=369639 RepID=A0A7J6DC48_9TELE|nr:hypothetical protein G5714_004200 [Onychostoma macrolepis]
MSNIPDLQLFPSDDKLFSCPETPTVATRVSSERTDPSQETPSERFGRRIQRSYKPRSRRLLSPPPSRSPVVTAPRPSLHSTAAISPIPPISKWSVNSLRQALSNSGLHFSRRSSKAQLYDLLSNYNNSSSIPTNSSTSKKKNQSSFTPVSPPRADPSARLPSLAIPPPLSSFNVNSSHPLLLPSGSQIPPNVPPGAVPSVGLPPQRTLSPLFPANPPPPLASAPPCHLGHQSLLGLPAQHPSTSSGLIHLPQRSFFQLLPTQSPWIHLQSHLTSVP